MDLKELLDEIRQVNLCTWYLLPLTGLTRLSFGDGLFINSYLEPHRLWIIVQVPDITLVSKSVRERALSYWNDHRGGFLVYQIPYKWESDVHKFIKGKYSRFSKEVKSIIFERSGLPYQQPGENEGSCITDIRLMVVESKREVREYMKEELGVTDGDLPDELLSAPPPESFMEVKEV